MQPFTFNSLKVLLVIIISIFTAYFINIENKYLLIFTRGLITTIIFVNLLIVLKVFSIKEIKDEITSLKNTFT